MTSVAVRILHAVLVLLAAVASAALTFVLLAAGITATLALLVGADGSPGTAAPGILLGGVFGPIVGLFTGGYVSYRLRGVDESA